MSGLRDRCSPKIKNAGATVESAAADEMNDFVAVAGEDFCFLPFLARENFEIALDRDATLRHAKMLEQRDHIQSVGNFATFSVDRDSHGLRP